MPIRTTVVVCTLFLLCVTIGTVLYFVDDVLVPVNNVVTPVFSLDRRDMDILRSLAGGHESPVDTANQSSTGTQNRYVRIVCGGRLGNQMFDYAALYNIKRRTAWKPYFLYTKFCKDIKSMRRAFPNLSFPMLNKRVENDIIVKAVNFTSGETGLNELLKEYGDYNVSLLGHFESHTYFTRFQEELRFREFKFSSVVMRNAQSYFRSVTPSKWLHTSFVRVGIHVRRTDQITKERIEMGNVLHTPSYFRHAMAHFTNLYDRVQFIIASDDTDWCKIHLNHSDTVFSETEDEVLDLAILSSCDHVIISLGTYSWWAGWLCRGTTVYYGVRPPNGTKMAEMHSGNDWIPPPPSLYNNWISVV